MVDASRVFSLVGMGVLALSLLGCGGGGGGDPTPHITVTSPNGGETWFYQGADQVITWTSAGVAGNVDVHYSVDGGTTWNPVALDIADAGSYAWTIPDEDSAECLVRVQETGGAGLSGASDAPFSIAPARITVTSPNGGETWYYEGPDRDITWPSGAVTGNIDVHYSVDAGGSWTAVALDIPDTGSYTWAIPDEDSDQCLVRVREAGGAGLNDVSDGPFTMCPLPPAAFTNIFAGLTGAYFASLAWGDYDNDGDLDIALAGSSSGYFSKVYENDGGTFTDIGAGLTGVWRCSLAWADYDNDGDLDIALAGATISATPYDPVSVVLENSGGTFADTGAGLTDVCACFLAWGDYDNDGDLDLVLAGLATTGYTTELYQNDSGTFAGIGAGLVGVGACSLVWGDYDNDGDLDLALAGSSSSGYVSKLYNNDGGTLTDIGAGLTPVSNCSLAWGDYDNDGDLDLALAGAYAPSVSKIYRNEGGTFTDINAGLTDVSGCSLAWGDYDNDGDLDLALAGSIISGGTISKIYSNDAGAFTDSGVWLVGMNSCSLAWSDYDNDGDLDLALAGNGFSRIYRNDGVFFNTPPSAPTGLSATAASGEATFSWNGATDAETAQAALTYNLYVRSSSGNIVMPAMSDAATGERLVPAMGNVQQNTSWTLTLPSGTYYWSAQAVDTAFAGSPWATEETVSVP